jgi:DNA-binding transcriptional regulator YdaS (Cro superfamily)
MNTSKKQVAFGRACDLVGGQARMARLLNVRPPTVNQWVHLVKQIPAERCPEIEKLTNGVVRCEELRPDIDWAYLRSTVTTPKPHIPEPSPIPEAEASLESSSAAKMLIIDTSDRRDDERRNGERRNGERRRNSNGGGLRVGERRVGDRRSCDRRD